MDNQTKIYWEKQGYDQLCGVHCVNSLLQGPYINEVVSAYQNINNFQKQIDLANLALELDIKEKTLMATEGFTNEFKQYLQEGSNNVADDGNFSIQVLAEGLKKVSDLNIESVDSQINQNKDLGEETGFICNSSSHWFAIRKVEGSWYNLNSTTRSGPQIISDFFLSAFLQSIRENGYTVFVVREAQEKEKKKNAWELNIGGSDDRELKKALRRSKLQSMNQQKLVDSDSFDNTSDEEYVNKVFQEKKNNKKNVKINIQNSNKKKQSSKKRSNYPKFDLYMHDQELAYVIEMTLRQQYEKLPEEGLLISFIMPEGNQIQWMFDKESTVEDLYDYVLISRPQNKKYQFILSCGDSELMKVEQKLKELITEDNQTLLVGIMD